MQFRVWHIPQLGMDAEPFHVEVPSLEMAKHMRDTLARYDLFQFENKIKPDYCNAQGIEQLVDGEWEEIDED